MKILLALLLSMLPVCACAQAEISGSYDGVLVAYNPSSGVVSGYQNTSTGNGQFSCIFYFSGKLDNNKAAVKSYFPGDLGSAHRAVTTGKVSVNGNVLNLELAEEPGGCWNSMPADSKKDNGAVVYTLTRDQSVKAGNWQSIGIVKNDKTYFYNSPSALDRRKAYLVKGDGVAVLQNKGEWLEVEYTSGSKPTKGWIKTNNLYKLE